MYFPIASTFNLWFEDDDSDSIDLTHFYSWMSPGFIILQVNNNTLRVRKETILTNFHSVSAYNIKEKEQLETIQLRENPIDQDDCCPLELLNSSNSIVGFLFHVLYWYANSQFPKPTSIIGFTTSVVNTIQYNTMQPISIRDYSVSFIELNWITVHYICTIIMNV